MRVTMACSTAKRVRLNRKIIDYSIMDSEGLVDEAVVSSALDNLMVIYLFRHKDDRKRC